MSRATRFAIPVCLAAALVTSGCTTMPAFPTLPPWQDLSAEREARKQETLDHIQSTREKAAEIEQASFAKPADAGALTPPSRTDSYATADRLPSQDSSDASASSESKPPEARPTEDAIRSAAERAVALDDLEEAIRLYRELVQRRPDDPAAHHSVALVAERLGLHEEAARHYQAAVRIAPNESLYRLCWEAHADMLVSERHVDTLRR